MSINYEGILNISHIIFVSKFVLSPIDSLQLEMIAFINAANTDLFLLLRASVHRLKIFADSIEFKMLLDSVVLERIAKQGDSEREIRPIDMYVFVFFRV